MNGLDWLVLLGTLGFIVGYGVWRSREVKSMDDYVRGGNTLAWPTIGLSIMATQASAITFLSTPGQAYQDGMRFVQFYFGLPLAMIVIAIFFVPAFYRLKVYTAYEYLEHRFDARVRYLGAILFLLQRGLAAGITIYAPAIILSSIFGWSLDSTIWAMGLGVIVYTVSGGTRAVSVTQKHQMIVMLSGLVVAAIIVVIRLPPAVSLTDALKLAGALDRMNVVTFDLDFKDRYNVWSGVIGGFFLAMAYFGTDQSQVQRYLSGQTVAQSRLGLLFNGMFKVPMQFVILFIGVMVFVFYTFTKPPIFFNAPTLARVAAGEHAPALRELERRYDQAFVVQQEAAGRYVAALDLGEAETAAARESLRAAAADTQEIRAETKTLIKQALPDAEVKDVDYVFLSFVLGYIPHGIVGLLIAVIFCAAMSSTSSELTALGSASMLDLYKRARHGRRAGPPPSEKSDLVVSKLFTVLWGAVAIAFATFASLIDNLIQAVNILGSIFYGTVLGLFVVGFFVKRVGAGPVLLGALVAQATVTTLFFTTELGFLWYTVVGCGLVVAVGLGAEQVRRAGR